MADPEHLATLEWDVTDWNEWRRANPDIVPNLSGADLAGADLSEADLSGTDLFGVALFGADLSGAKLSGARLLRADLDGAELSGADLSEANLHMAKLSGADLSEANLFRANLFKADLASADLRAAKLRRADLSGADVHMAKLAGADLVEADLSGANLHMAKLSGADLSSARLLRTDLSLADLSKAKLTGAALFGADLFGAGLPGADLSSATLFGTNLRRADLRHAKLTEACLRETILADLDLSQTVDLDRCVHEGPSVVDIRTLQRSGPLPLDFLRGVGLPDKLIDDLPALLDRAARFYSCFISYASEDQPFAGRLYADLQNKGVRCWFAPHDMRTGARILDEIDEAVRVRDKVLVILSESSIASAWVAREVMAGLDEEHRCRGRMVLFPIRIDDAVLTSPEPWARLLRRERHIGDFTRWEDHDAYRSAFERLLRDLRKDEPAAQG